MSSTKLMAVGVIAAVALTAMPQTPQAMPRPRPQVVPWSAAAGRPKIDFKKASGIYIWHEGDRFHLVSASNTPGADAVNGLIALRQGQMWDLDPIRREKGDNMKLDQNRVRFHLQTARGSDGLEFSLRGGRFLLVNVVQPGVTKRNLYVGGRQISTNGNRVLFDLTR